MQEVEHDVRAIRAKYQECSYLKAEVIPPRTEEPRQVPTAEAKGLPNPAPSGPWEPTTHTQIWFTLLNHKLPMSFLGVSTMTLKRDFYSH